jgi:RNA polymerase sigma-70 factor (ECF subfamily)
MNKKFEEYSDSELFYMLCDEKKTAEKAFSELYARHSSLIYSYILRFLGNRDEAQDVFQETLVRFHQSASKDRDMTNVPGFLMTIARNLCVNAKRSAVTSVSFEDYMAFHDDDRKKHDKDEQLELIKMALDLLPDEYRETFILREYQGYSYKEIAELTNETLTNVKVRIHRARNKIREILEPYLKEMKKYENN